MTVSVIIPAYNCASTIEKTINSVLEQDYDDIELIVVNDGSYDNTSEILSLYGDRIKLITKENGGVASARNQGLLEAKGDFIMFLDSDDCIKEGCISRLVKKQIETSADIIRFEYVLSYPDGRISKPLHCFDEEQIIFKESFKEKIYPFFINSIMLNSICVSMFRKSLLKGLSFRTDMETAEDAVFSVGAYNKAEKVLILPEELYIYNQTAGSLTGSGLSVWKKYKCNFKLSAEIIKHLSDWDMKNPYWYFKTWLRPVVLTFDKIRRIRGKKDF